MITDLFYDFFTIFIGCVYPAYATYKMLSGNRRSTNAPDIWSPYWIVYGIYTFINQVASVMFSWIPCIREIRLLLTCWMVPTLGGASQPIYYGILVPYLFRNEEAIDGSIAAIYIKSCQIFALAAKFIYHMLLILGENLFYKFIEYKRELDSYNDEDNARQMNNNMYKQSRQNARNSENEHGRSVMAQTDQTMLQSQSDASQSKMNVSIPHIIQLPMSLLNQEFQDVEKGLQEAYNGPLDEPNMKAIEKSNSEIELNILMAEAITAQRLQLGNQMAYKEHLARINSFMQNKELQLSCPTDNPRPHRPECPPKPRRLKHKAISAELDHLMSEYKDSNNEEAIDTPECNSPTNI